MKTRFLSIFIALWSVTSFAEDLPTNYTLTPADYELVGNGHYHTFDIRQIGKEADPYVILQKLDHILLTNFIVLEEYSVIVNFKAYDGTNTETIGWKLYVENSRFRTSKYVLSASYYNLGNSTTLDIATWNIEHFPKHEYSSSKAKQIIIDSKLDVIGLQEIGDDAGEFEALLSDLGDGYSGFINNPIGVEYDMNLAVIYKKDEISLVTQGKEICELKEFFSYRVPIEIVLKHNSGVEFVLIVIHLKCCNGSEDIRRKASLHIKKYIDNTYKASNTNVIVVGDWNDRIDSDETDLVFRNFMDDSENYIFTDADASEVTKDGPGWANIDHILINKSLFNIYDKPAGKLKGSNFDYNYDEFVSDHFPVWVNLNVELLGVDANYVYKSKLNIYPNPSSGDFIHVDFPNGIETATIIITNPLGQEVYKEETNSKVIDISDFVIGYYVITLKTENGIYTSKFVKE
ncbi:MAG: T9SS type A sorting domain-containing protein [Flavobacteriales bacterium]|nr:T9SS type A sorting domain-containing protein [Flavobacteriales bacterium]